MKKLPFILLVLVALSGIRAKVMVSEYSFRCFPLQDTLVAGLDNELQVLVDGKIKSDLIVTGLNATVRYTGEGKYSVTECKADQPVQLVIFNGDDIKTQLFPVVAQTDALNKRIAALDAARKNALPKDSLTAAGPVYTLHTTPLNDTLLPGMDNTLQIYVDGKPNKEFEGVKMSVAGALFAPSGTRGIYSVKPLDNVHAVHVNVLKNDKLVLSKDLLVPVMTPELQKRAAAAPKN